jgi:serine/threonine protein kinase
MCRRTIGVISRDAVAPRSHVWATRFELRDREEVFEGRASAYDEVSRDGLPHPKTMSNLETHSYGPGTVLGPYTLTRRLGAGGMGEVHEAMSPRGLVALKLLTWGRGAPEALARFEREASLLESLAHPGIVPVIDHGVDARTHTPYLVMALLEGEDLSALLDRVGRLSPEVVVAMGRELVDALAHAHYFKVIHRDIKPANVFVPRDRVRGRAILCDFGLSKQLDLSASLTDTGARIGTPYYMSPEQFLDAKRVDSRSDVFSLAMTLYHALVGKNPFEDLASNAELLTALCTRPVPDPRSKVAGLPDDLVEALRSALVTDARQRASLEDFTRALARCDGSRLTPSYRPPPPDGVGVTQATSAPAFTQPGGGAYPSESTRPRRASSLAPPAPMLELNAGRYRIGKRLEDDIHEGMDEYGMVVRLERLPGILESAEGRAAFDREAVSLRGVLTESVVALLDHGVEGNDGWLVTEPVAGADLQTLVEDGGTLPFARTVRAFAGAARGLAALHEDGVVHGHIAPDSLHFRTGNGRRILVMHDLGIKKRLAAATLARSKRGGAVATKDPRTDVVQLAAALHFALIGKLPFGKSTGRAARADASATTLATPDPRARSALDELVRRVIEGRVESLAALADDLDRMADESRATVV